MVASVQYSVKTEMSTWSNIVQKNVNTTNNSIRPFKKLSEQQLKITKEVIQLYRYKEEKEDLELGCAENCGEINAFPKPPGVVARRVGQKAGNSNISSFITGSSLR